MATLSNGARTLLLIATLCSAGIHYAHADRGERLFSVTCDRENNEFTVEPFMVWNLENAPVNAALFSEVLERKRVQRDSTTYYAGAETIHDECWLGDRWLTVEVQERRLTILDNGFPLLERHIAAVWDVYGPLYYAKLSKDGNWLECCMTASVPFRCIALYPGSRDTNC